MELLQIGDHLINADKLIGIRTTDERVHETLREVSFEARWQCGDGDICSQTIHSYEYDTQNGGDTKFLIEQAKAAKSILWNMEDYLDIK